MSKQDEKYKLDSRIEFDEGFFEELTTKKLLMRSLKMIVMNLKQGKEVEKVERQATASVLVYGRIRTHCFCS
jgi:hypothetical protein